MHLIHLVLFIFLSFTNSISDFMKCKECATCEVSIINIEKRNIHFERKVSYSGRSLIISIPEDLARYMNLTKENRVRIIPVDRNGFLVEKV